MLKKIFIFLLLFDLCFSYGLRDIKEMQKGLAKDFFIYEYLKNHSPTKEEAQILKRQIFRKTYRLEKLFNKYIKDEELSFKYKCLELKQKELLKANAKCLKFALNPRKFQNLSQKDKKILHKKLKSEKEFSWLSPMIQEDVFSSLIKQNGEDFIKIFLSVDEKYRQKILNKILPLKFLNSLTKQRNFENFVLHVVLQGDYKNLSHSLLNLDPNKQNLTYDTAFYLGILAMKSKKPKKAYLFFKSSNKNAQNPEQRDKALFWMYKASSDKEYLNKLSKSKRFNFYSLLAREDLKAPDFQIQSPRPTKEDLEYYSITDPFSWEFTKKYIKDLDKKHLKAFARQFFTKQTLPYYVYLSQKFYGFDKIYFITPYEKYIKNLPTKRKILLYALARQESRCIPVDVSKSYALGLMQFMPFLARNMAKQKNIKDFTYFDMFKPKIALEFASSHLDYLEKFLFHPLFIAYAYNGGIGFTRRMLLNTKLFKNGSYEPYLSMELVPYKESRQYGKKVLANYAIYAKMYKENITLTYLLKSLTQSSNPLFR